MALRLRRDAPEVEPTEQRPPMSVRDRASLVLLAVFGVLLSAAGFALSVATGFLAAALAALVAAILLQV